MGVNGEVMEGGRDVMFQGPRLGEGKAPGFDAGRRGQIGEAAECATGREVGRNEACEMRDKR